jgi:hypothetical protein
MSSLQVQLDREWVRPGGTVRARLHWELDDRPDKLVVRLLWYTEGRGTRDVGVIAEEELAFSGLTGDTEVELAVPEGPYSFSGRLITLRWVVELAVEPEGEAEQAPLVVGPTPVPVQLVGSA